MNEKEKVEKSVASSSEAWGVEKVGEAEDTIEDKKIYLGQRGKERGV